MISYLCGRLIRYGKFTFLTFPECEFETLDGVTCVVQKDGACEGIRDATRVTMPLRGRDVRMTNDWDDTLRRSLRPIRSHTSFTYAASGDSVAAGNVAAEVDVAVNAARTVFSERCYCRPRDSLYPQHGEDLHNSGSGK